uniref:Chromo domain-containing protein n=1 Tax=Meloidogyne hapla TaxID=6305 RepID=A0A1I8BTM2_MELHA
MLNLRPPSNRGLVTPPPRLPTPPPIIEGQYEVQSILTSRIVRHLRSGIEIRQFLIKWKNYSYQELTWEDENNLIDCEDIKNKWLQLHIGGTTPLFTIRSWAELDSTPKHKYNGWTDAEISDDDEQDPEWGPYKQKRQCLKLDPTLSQDSSTVSPIRIDEGRKDVEAVKKRKKHGGRDLCGAERKRRRKAKLLGLSTSNENSG